MWLLTGFLLVNLLVLLEVADRLSLKNDLEIAREIQQAMLPRAAFQARRARSVRHDPAGQHRGRRFLRHPSAARRARAAGARRCRRQGQPGRAADGAAAGDDAHARGRRARGRRPGGATQRADREARAATRASSRCSSRCSIPRPASCRTSTPARIRRCFAARTDRTNACAPAAWRWACSRTRRIRRARTMLEPGDVIVMYSDGITEAEDTLDQPFDEAGVQSVVDGGTGRRRRSWAGRCLQPSKPIAGAAAARRSHGASPWRRLPPLPHATVALSSARAASRSRVNWRLMSPVSVDANGSSSLTFVCLAGHAPSSPRRREPDPVARAAPQRRASAERGDRPALAALFAPAVAEAEIELYYRNDLFMPGAVQAIVRERDRAPLEGAPPGDGFTPRRRVLRRDARTRPNPHRRHGHPAAAGRRPRFVADRRRAKASRRSTGSTDCAIDTSGR